MMNDTIRSIWSRVTSSYVVGCSARLSDLAPKAEEDDLIRAKRRTADTRDGRSALVAQLMRHCAASCTAEYDTVA